MRLAEGLRYAGDLEEARATARTGAQGPGRATRRRRSRGRQFAPDPGRHTCAPGPSPGGPGASGAGRRDPGGRRWRRRIEHSQSPPVPGRFAGQHRRSERRGGPHARGLGATRGRRRRRGYPSGHRIDGTWPPRCIAAGSRRARPRPSNGPSRCSTG